MNNIINIQNQERQLTLDSREVAQMMKVSHWEVLRKLEGNKKIKGIIPTLANNKIVVSDYFIKSSYKDESGKENRCYKLTKMGCEFLANKFTGEKGILFTARYVKAFNEMEQLLTSTNSIPTTALNEISELINNTLVKKIAEIEGAIDTKFNSKLEELKEYYKPTHAAKIALCNYIKKRLGVDGPSKEYELVKQRILLMLNADKWQDVPFETLIESMGIIDNSIEVIKATRVTKQVSIFD